jgi:hypothetical protein
MTEVTMEQSEKQNQQLKSIDLIIVKGTEELCTNIAIHQY